MKILLVNINTSNYPNKRHPRRYPPPFILKYLQALLLTSKHFEVKFLDCFIHPLSLEKLQELVLSFSPAALVLSFNTAGAKLALELGKKLKASLPLLILAVGVEVTWRFEKYICADSPFDTVIRGEAEEEAFLLLETFRRSGSIQSLKEIFNNSPSKAELHLVKDLDRLPFPPYTEEELRQYYFLYPLKLKERVKWGHILSSRGCSFQCRFCSQEIRESYGKDIRFRSPANVVKEMQNLQRLGANVISFDDDNFTFNPAQVQAICEEILKQNLRLPWIAQSRVDTIETSLLPLMQRAGCALLKLGVESGSPKILEAICKTQHNTEWETRCLEVFEGARRAGISTNALFIIGNPGEEREDLEKSLKLMTKLRPDLIQVHIFTPYPGSHIYEELKKGIKEEELEKMFHYHPSSVNLSRLNLEDILAYRKKFYKLWLTPSRMGRHILDYSLFYLYNPRVFLDLCKVNEIIKGKFEIESLS
jgi:anaerobic magnesium-protoporphyrin IX monomethyl ester cyclase